MNGAGSGEGGTAAGPNRRVAAKRKVGQKRRRAAAAAVEEEVQPDAEPQEEEVQQQPPPPAAEPGKPKEKRRTSEEVAADKERKVEEKARKAEAKRQADSEAREHAEQELLKRAADKEAAKAAAKAAAKQRKEEAAEEARRLRREPLSAADGGPTATPKAVNGLLHAVASALVATEIDRRMMLAPVLMEVTMTDITGSGTEIENIAETKITEGRSRIKTAHVRGCIGAVGSMVGWRSGYTVNDARRGGAGRPARRPRTGYVFYRKGPDEQAMNCGRKL